ncbi:MAG: hypothetical protein KDH94_08405, partial [Coxiellaceae bacterium]|nr:hypothetical protein [Coxiellaceae bacterium]
LQTLRLPFVKYYASADDKCFDILTALQQTKPNSINEFLQILKGALGQTTLTQDKKVKTSDCVEQYEALQQLDLSQQDKYDAKCHLILLSLQNLVEVPDHLSHAICKIFKLEKFALQLLRNELAHGYSSVSESRLDELCAQIKAAADTIDNSHSKKVTPNHGDITFVGEENKSPSPKPKAAGAKPYNPTSVFAPPPHAQSAFKANAAVYSSTPKGGFNAHARSYDPRPKPPGKS